MKKGIIIFALGHPNYYRMADVLAASLIVNGCREADISICLICDDQSKVKNPTLYNDFVVLDNKKFHENGKFVFMKAIVLAYDLSPYDITLKLDADMVWIPKRSIADLFNKLIDVDFTISNRGYFPIGHEDSFSLWAEKKALIETYHLKGDEKLYEISAEFFWFKKGPVARDIFSKVKKIYKERKVKSVGFANGAFTEELAFQIVFLTTDITPHQDNFTPIYNEYLCQEVPNRLYPYQLTQFYGYSMFANRNIEFKKTNYNNMAKSYFATLGLSNAYQVQDKRSFLPERKML